MVVMVLIECSTKTKFTLVFGLLPVPLLIMVLLVLVVLVGVGTFPTSSRHPPDILLKPP